MLWLLLPVIAATFIGYEPTMAGTLVEFPNLPGRKPEHLTGYLARPRDGLSALIGTTAVGAPPYPAVVVLHGCGGISSHSAAIADRLGGWGYVTLTVDTLGPRGMDHCYSSTFMEQAFDAYAAWGYLSKLTDVNAERVALLGQSMGGSATLYAIDRNAVRQYFSQRFRAAIAYYPRCGVVPEPAMTAPMLILIGEADQWNSADACTTMKNLARPESASISLTVYPGVHHAFDVVQLKPGLSSDGRWLEYNEPAARDAEARVRALLAANLGAAATDEATAK
jgi:dienelactone hydrolase